MRVLHHTRCVDASVRLLRGVLAQHHACGEIALVGVRFGAPLAFAMRAAMRAAARGAERKPPHAPGDRGRSARGGLSVSSFGAKWS